MILVITFCCIFQRSRSQPHERYERSWTSWLSGLSDNTLSKRGYHRS